MKSLPSSLFHNTTNSAVLVPPPHLLFPQFQLYFSCHERPQELPPCIFCSLVPHSFKT